MASPLDRLGQLLQTGDVLEGRYRLNGILGAGAYGVVYDGTALESGQRVAIKALPPAEAGSNSTALGRFHREMLVIRNLVHPNIIGVYDWGETASGVTFMVLEFVSGTTLDRVVRHQPMTPEVALDVVRQIASALWVAHDLGIIHRDLKPANIMVSPRAVGGYDVKILDFGMAKVLGSLNDETLAELTREGMAVGTPRYIAPEQARGLTVTPSTDLYAVGLLFYETLTGEQAVKADTVQAAVAAHVSREPLPLPELPVVPSAWRPVVLKLLQKDPKRRYAHASELIGDLDALAPPVAPGREASQEPLRWSTQRVALALGKPGEWGDGDEETETVGYAALTPALISDLPGGPAPETRVPAPAAAPARAAGAASFPVAASQVAPPRAASASASLPHAAPAPRAMAPSVAPSPSLELDEEAFSRYAPKPIPAGTAEKFVSRPKRPLVRLPGAPHEFLETALALALFPLSFILSTAHLHRYSDGLAWGVGLAPFGLSLLLSLAERSSDWNESLWRRWWILGILAFLAAHALGPGALANELQRNPGWFLPALEGLPGERPLSEMVMAVSQAYAQLLRMISQAVAS